MSRLKAQGRILEAIIAVTILALALISLKSLTNISALSTTPPRSALRESLNRVLFILDTYGYVDQYLLTKDSSIIRKVIDELLPNTQYEVIIIDIVSKEVLLEIGQYVEAPFIEESYIKIKPIYYANPILIKITISSKEIT